MAKKGKRVAVCIPSRGEMEIGTAFDLSTMVGYDARFRKGETALYTVNGTLIFDQREKLAKEAIKDGADYILWIDADMRFPKNTIDNLFLNDHITHGNPMTPFDAELQLALARDGVVHVFLLPVWHHHPQLVVPFEAPPRRVGMDKLSSQGGLPTTAPNTDPTIGVIPDNLCVVESAGHHIPVHLNALPCSAPLPDGSHIFCPPTDGLDPVIQILKVLVVISHLLTPVNLF